MCGIVASVGSTSKEVMVSMRDTLRHRGPDGVGLAWWPEAALAQYIMENVETRDGRNSERKQAS